MSRFKESHTEVSAVKDHRVRPAESPLWPHLEEIRSMRRARKSWAAIALQLREAHGIETTRENLYRFFQRAANTTAAPIVAHDTCAPLDSRVITAGRSSNAPIFNPGAFFSKLLRLFFPVSTLAASSPARCWPLHLPLVRFSEQ
jgi:hypothetical protein